VKEAFYFSIAISCFVVCAVAPSGRAQTLDYLFKSGSEGYHTFRIPAIITTSQGHVLAFAEGRKHGASDTGDIDIVMKRSLDGGQTWGGLQVLWDQDDNVCGNPAPVVDRTTGVIYLLTTWNLGEDHESEIILRKSKDTRRVFVMESKDEGASWSEPEEITSSVKLENWTWYATGPCHGIQLEKGQYQGRMIIPCDHIEAESKKYYSHIIYSDDHGKSWKVGGTTPQDQVNECAVAELSDGTIMLNMRNYDRSQKTRKISLSVNAGKTWSDIFADTALIEPICQASLLQYSSTNHETRRLLFSNPAHESKRERMTLRLSYNDGDSWPKSLVLFPGPSAYSDLVKLPDGTIGCLYEAGYDNPYEGIVFQKVPLYQLEN
jgi:sialidase-1